jgi:TctA family transporter
MDLLQHLALGFSVAVTPENLIYCFIGALLGTLIGVLPGIGPTATVSMLLPITYHLSPTASMIMLAGVYYGAQYGGSTTAILVNLPGETSSTVTAIDGYQLARQGRAGSALAIAAIGSFAAGCFATLLIAIFALPLANVAIQFGSTEYFSLIILGFITATALARGSVLKAVAMIVTGMLIGTVGTDVYTGAYRFTYNILDLADGFTVVAVALGLFGLAEVMRNLEKMPETGTGTAPITSLMPSREELRRSIAPIMRGSILGSLLGVLPGGGAVLSAFTSYTIEKKLSKRPEKFGYGAIEGVAAPESANNAGAQTSFVPMLTLGIPSSGLMALMVGALMIQGITPGPNVVHRQPELFWGIIASMWIGNLMLVILNLPLIGIWVSLLKIPYRILMPSIVAFCMIGVYTVENSTSDVVVLAGFGLLGYLFYKLDCEPAPLLMGLVLGRLLEEHFRRAMNLASGDPMVFLTNPISATLLVVAVVVLLMMMMPSIMKKREQVFAEEE